MRREEASPSPLCKIRVSLPKDDSQGDMARVVAAIINKRRYLLRSVWRLLCIAGLVSGLILANPAPAYALSIDDYFSYSYSIKLDRTEVYRDEVFSATVSGQAVCKKTLPFGITPNAASVTSRITARHDATGYEVVLNSAYTVAIDTFPTNPGDSIQETVVVPLAFPGDSPSGTYTITGEIVEAKVHVLAFWLDVTGYLPSSQVLGSVTCFTRYVSDTGEFLMKYTAKSPDGKAAVTIQSGTTGLSQQGTPLSEITVTEKGDPPPPSPDTEFAGPVYDFGPEGASFNRAVTIRLTYDDAELPEGVNEEHLVVAVWDSQFEEWHLLDTTVDPVNNIITAEVNHFTLYSIIAHTRPADFTVSDLSITPAEAAADARIDISVLVSNAGDLTGVYQLQLKVNGEVYFVRSARLAGGDSVTESFPVYWNTPGTYIVNIAGLSGIFTIEIGELPSIPDTDDTTPAVAPVTLIVDVTPVEIADGESIAMRVLITNTSDIQDTCRASLKKDNIRVETKEVSLASDTSQAIIFTVLKETTAVYTVEVTGPSGVFTVEDMPLSIPETPTPTPPTATLNWWLVGGSIATGIIIVLLAAIIIARRKRQKALR